MAGKRPKRRGPGGKGPGKPAPGRRGCNSFAAIPASLKRALDTGREHPMTLAEWLAIDPARLLRAVLPDLGLPARGFEERRALLLREADRLRGERASVRSRGMGAAIHRAARGHRSGRTLLDSLAAHPSPVVRSWAAYALLADPDPDLRARIGRAERFAADEDSMVRECAWESFRPWLADRVEEGIRALRPWVRSRDARIRRCAVEATRPRGVWTRHIEALRCDPSPGLALLEPVRSDPSPYVRTAVGNWLNDASKSRPGWVRSVLARWRRESRTPETEWIIRHAARTLRRQAQRG